MKATFDYKLFGLEPRDLAVYEAMLGREEAVSIRTLAELVRFNRGTTFEIIKKLVRLGLVSSHYKMSRKQYVALEPGALQRLAEERSRAVQSQMSDVQSYVHELKSLQPLDAAGRFGQLYEGEDEIALLLHDVLDESSKLPEKSYRVVSSAEVSNHMYKKFENFTRQRIKQGIQVKVIGIGGSDKLAELAERRWLSSEQMPPCYLIVYGNKVAQIALRQNDEVIGSVIENAGVAQLQKLLFDRLWNTLEA